MNVVLHNYTTSGMYTDYSCNVRLKDMLSENSIEHGLYLCHSSTNFIIENCIFRNNAGSGIQTNGENMNPDADDAIIVKRCRIYGNGISGYNDVRSRNIVLYRNLFVAGVQKAIEVMGGSLGNKYYHNVFVSTAAGRPAIGMSNAQNNSFANNIFYVQTDALTTGGSVISSDYHGLYAKQRADHSPIYNWSLSLAQWQSATGQDAHSMVVDPQFVSFDINGDPANWDLHLKRTSSLIDRGTSISATLGESYTFAGTGPDIGMYEYVPSLTLRGAAGNQAIRLAWEVSTVVPVTTTWHIEYYTTTATVPFTATDPLSTTRVYTLTGLTNYQWYTVTLTSVGTNPVLSDTVCVMPTDILVHLPLVMREG
jgi:hypothetical protein